MKKLITTTLTASLMAGSAMAEANLGIDFANAHIFRGSTVAKDFVVQPTAELSGFGMPEEYGAFTLGAWGSMAPFSDAKYLQDTFYETDWYAAYTLPALADGLDLYVGLTEYTYKTADNERELNVGAGYDVGGFGLGASANFMLNNQIGDATEGQIYLDFTADYALDLSEAVDVAVGGLISYVKHGDGNKVFLDNGLNHFELYGAVGYDLSEMWMIDGSLAYVGQFDDKTLPDAGPSGRGGYEVNVLFTVGLSCEM